MYEEELNKKLQNKIDLHQNMQILQNHIICFIFKVHFLATNYFWNFNFCVSIFIGVNKWNKRNSLNSTDKNSLKRNSSIQRWLMLSLWINYIRSIHAKIICVKTPLRRLIYVWTWTLFSSFDTAYIRRINIWDRG